MSFTDASEAEKAFFSIDDVTGVIYVPNTHNFANGDTYKVSVKVTNPYGEFNGTGALTLNVIDWMDPLADFTYEVKDMKQGMSYISSKPQGGGLDAATNVEYSFVDMPEEYAEYFSINNTTGEVSVAKYNTLPQGTFEVTVKAKNFKSEAQGKLAINVIENPNYFTYISYGNNLVDDQTPGNIYDNQFRFTKLDEVRVVSLNPKTDIQEGRKMTWKLAGKHHSANIVIDTNTGEITAAGVTQDNFNKYSMAVLFITATVGEGNDAFDRTFPVFINYSKPVAGVTIEYTPFVLRVNPNNGGTSLPPVITGNNIDLSKVYIDYYNTINYFNLEGCDSEGTPFDEGRVDQTPGCKFLKNLWNENGASGNYGTNLPVSYWDGNKVKTNPSDYLAYINNAKVDNRFSVVVNPKKWYYDGWADGVLTSKFKFSVDGTNPPGKTNSDFYLAIWFDKDYVNENN